MKDIEIEIQVRIVGAAKLEEFLTKQAKFKGQNYQKDEYFTPAHRDFTAVKPVAEWLRLRESKSNSITYKKWHYDESGKSQYADEYESKVEDTVQLRKIFAAVDIRPLITVDKTRRIWDYQDYEVAIDKVAGLGDFVEVEYKGSDQSADPKQVTDGMVEFLKTAGCSQIERNYVGYPFMLLYPDEVKFEAV